MRNFHKGQKVKTPLGEGIVNYQRMAYPNYSEAEFVSVFLKKKLEEMNKPPFPNYSGTIFPAKDIEILE